MPLVLFGERDPKVYRLDQIYDPDIDGLDPEASGKTIPAVGSVVLDMSVVSSGEPIPAYSVVSVDQTTYKSTLRPLTSIIELDAIPDRILSYGNDKHMLYYDDDTNPTSLRIDSNLMILGDNSAEYILYKRNVSTGEEEVISMYIDANNQIQGERVPIIETPVPGVRRGNDCFTSVPLEDNDLIIMKVFDASGIQIMELTLVAKQATILNDLDASIDVVTGFDVSANQQLATGEFVLFVGQNKEDLAIFPELEFSTGEKLTVPVDDMVSFMYGWDLVKTDLAGCEYDVLFKYYLNDHVLSTIAEGDRVRFVTKTKTVVIQYRNQYGFSKVSVLPKWNPTTNQYDLRFFAYYQTRGGFEDITTTVEFINGTSFDGSATKWGEKQHCVIRAEMPTNLGTTANYEQTFYITCTEPGMPSAPIRDVDGHIINSGTNENENYLIQAEEDSVLVYGSNDGNHNRPVINYDETLEQYFIPTSEFISADKFLEFFYIDAEPPFIPPNESIAPDPTHFTIRNINTGAVILPDVIPVENYHQLMSFITTPGSPEQFSDTSVVVEFLLQQGTGYQVLYGVPVEVVPGVHS